MGRRRSSDISSRIQSAAIRLFTEKGYKEITMVEIAYEAGVANRKTRQTSAANRYAVPA
jgi:AcrR family transcriptional regulator